MLVPLLLLAFTAQFGSHPVPVREQDAYTGDVITWYQDADLVAVLSVPARKWNGGQSPPRRRGEGQSQVGRVEEVFLGEVIAKEIKVFRPWPGSVFICGIGLSGSKSVFASSPKEAASLPEFCIAFLRAKGKSYSSLGFIRLQSPKVEDGWRERLKHLQTLSGIKELEDWSQSQAAQLEWVVGKVGIPVMKDIAMEYFLRDFSNWVKSPSLSGELKPWRSLSTNQEEKLLRVLDQVSEFNWLECRLLEALVKLPDSRVDQAFCRWLEKHKEQKVEFDVTLILEYVRRLGTPESKDLLQLFWTKMGGRFGRSWYFTPDPRLPWDRHEHRFRQLCLLEGLPTEQE